MWYSIQIIFSFVLAFYVLLCNGAKPKVIADKWWEYCHIYQVYPRSFQDSNGDGIGDLNGITSRLPYLKEIGVDGLWLSPIFPSPLIDLGYDISDFRDIHPQYGNMSDFDRMLCRCKTLGIKLILDLVPNHTSDQHDWFQKSSNPTDPEFQKYKDYYIWNKGKLSKNGNRIPPSNWRSVFGGSAWRWSESRQAYYLHQFLAEQPDLNFRNPIVVDEIDEIMRFWLRKGVAGFRVDAVAYLLEAPENSNGFYDDEPVNLYVGNPRSHAGLFHTKTMNLEESYELLSHFHDVGMEEEFSDYDRILMPEAYVSLSSTLKYYGKVENGVLTKVASEIPFNFELQIRTDRSTTAIKFRHKIEGWINGMPKGANGTKVHANWLLGNHDSERISSKYGPERIDLFNIMIKTLPGIAITYYGEEIGMRDVKINGEEVVDKHISRRLSRDSYRTPMQWDSTNSAGFSTSRTTWLPTAYDYTFVNVEEQKLEGVSHLKVFRKLIELRKNPTMKYGSLTIRSMNSDVLAYKRKIENDCDADIIAVVLNLGSYNQTVNLDILLSGVPNRMKIVVSSIHFFSNESKIDTQNIKIPPHVGLVLIGKEFLNVTCSCFPSKCLKI